MNEMKLFNFEENQIRVIKDDDKSVWFVGKDVAQALGYSNETDAMNRHCKGVVKRYPLMTSGGMQEIRVLSKGDVLRLICGSQLPSAQKFESWAFDEVLPAVLNGEMRVAPSSEMSDDEIMARGLLVAQRAIERKDAQIAEQTKQLQLQAPDVEYCNTVLAATNLHTTNSIAVHLGISAIRLNKFLSSEGWIYKQGDIYCPSHKIRSKHYCDFHIVPYLNRAGESCTREHLKWTEEGRRAIIELYTKKAA